MLSDKGLFRNHIYRAECLLQRGYRLEITNNANLFSVGDPAFDTARAVTQVVKAPLAVIVGNLVVRLRAPAVSNAHALADFHSLDGIDAHDRLRQLPVQPGFPTGMRTQP